MFFFWSNKARSFILDILKTFSEKLENTITCNGIQLLALAEQKGSFSFSEIAAAMFSFLTTKSANTFITSIIKCFAKDVPKRPQKS